MSLFLYAFVVVKYVITSAQHAHLLIWIKSNMGKPVLRANGEYCLCYTIHGCILIGCHQ